MICFRCMAVLRPHSFKNMPRNRVQDCGESNNRRNNNKLRMSLEIMMILAFQILKVSILNLCYIYIYAESEVRLIFSLISSAFLYDREGLVTLKKNLGDKQGWCQGCARRKIVGSPLAWTWKIQGAYSAYDFYAKTEIS